MQRLYATSRLLWIGVICAVEAAVTIFPFLFTRLVVNVTLDCAIDARRALVSFCRFPLLPHVNSMQFGGSVCYKPIWLWSASHLTCTQNNLGRNGYSWSLHLGLQFTGKMPTNDQPAQVTCTQTTCKTPLVTSPAVLLPSLFSSPSRGVKKKIYATAAAMRQIAAWH